jgi:8-oxo-dGTP pyrophosphatase MutT (NUDIX family)
MNALTSLRRNAEPTDNPPDQAAALALRTVNGRLEILLVTSRDTGRWVLPKGWIEPGESPLETALREASEEAGLKCTGETQPIGRFSYTKKRPRRGDRLCQVDVYQLAVTRQLKSWPEDKQRQRAWFDLRDAAAVIDESELCTLLLRIHAAATEISGHF